METNVKPIKESSHHIRARYEAIHSVCTPKGQPPDDRNCMADFEVEKIEADALQLEVMFDEVADGYRQSLMVRLDAHGARELAYSLLMFANDLE